MFALFLFPQEPVLPHEFDKLVKIVVIPLFFEVLDNLFGIRNVASFHHFYPAFVSLFVPMGHDPEYRSRKSSAFVSVNFVGMALSKLVKSFFKGHSKGTKNSVSFLTIP